MSSKPNITYLLGAGASFGTIPILNEISDKMFSQAQLLRGVGQLPQDFGSVLNGYIASLEWLSEESKNHNTVDTLAKKLFLNNDRKKLNELKSTLSLFFIILQFHDGTNKSKKKKPNIHYRYTSLISAFLEKKDDEISLPDNVKFISWNYDYQLELALENFNARLRSYPNDSNLTYNNNPSIVHLNGIAGLVSTGNYVGYLVNDINHSHLPDLLTEVLPVYKKINDPQERSFNFNKAFTYVWEENEFSKKSKELAIEIIKKTEYLIIIGYSFPVFNREFDRKLLTGHNFKKIYYQDIVPDKQALAATFGLDVSKVHEITKVDQFFLPFEF